MLPRRLARLCLFVVVFAVAPSAVAGQFTAAPTSYTVTEVITLFGRPATTVTFRDGPRAVVDNPVAHVRSYFDLTTSRTYNWSTAEADPQCGAGTFSGDWGDPFETSSLMSEIAELHPRDAGTEVVNGIRAKVVDADNAQAKTKIRLWIDVTYGEVIKWVATDADTHATTLLEVKSLTTGKPPAASFVLPPRCAKLASQPPAPTEADRIAALTGSPVGTYVAATTGPGSGEPCAVQFSIVEAKTMTPVRGGFRAGIDPSVDPVHPAAHVIGSDARDPKKPFFSGGGLHEITQLFQNGVATLASPAPTFDMELVFGDPGAASALLYRQCFGRSSARLFYVVKNPAKLSEGGDWLWAK